MAEISALSQKEIVKETSEHQEERKNNVKLWVNTVDFTSPPEISKLCLNLETNK